MTFFVAVPDVPGVPPVNFASPPIPLPTLLTADVVSQFSAVFSPQWGIFLNGAPVITSESVTGFEFRNDWTISDYPVEGGVFESYDKVLLPYLAKVRFASGSSPQARASLLSQVASAAQVVQGGPQPVYDVVTPEITYLSCSISHYDYRREASRGVGLVVVDVWVSQVIQQNSGVMSFASSAIGGVVTVPSGSGAIVTNPSSADFVSGGLIPTLPVDIGNGTGPVLQIVPPVTQQ